MGCCNKAYINVNFLIQAKTSTNKTLRCSIKTHSMDFVQISHENIDFSLFEAIIPEI